MRILLHSNSPFAPTGYGVQTKVFAPRLKRLGHDVAISAFWGLHAGVIHYQGMPIYPGGFHGYGLDVWSRHAVEFKADLIISLIDAWVLDADTLAAGQRWVPWFPVDMETGKGALCPPVRRQVERAYARIVFSKYGERVTRASGLDCYYVPHGYDPQAYYPDEDAAANVRELLGLGDRFVITSVMANKGTPSRKAWPQHLEAFAELHRRHPDTVYVCHTLRADRGENNGVNLPELARELEIEHAVVFPDQYVVFMGAPDWFMRGLYSASDVVANVAMGEGFGVPILEAQACGCPVIVGDWTAMSELCWAGWTVERHEAMRVWSPLAAYQWLPSPAAIYERMLHAYQVCRSMPDLRRDAAEAARRYDADVVTEDYWRPVLNSIAERIAEEAAAPQVAVETTA